MNFVAIDFETATPKRNSACAIGLAIVRNGEIVKKASTLIRPPELKFHPINQRINGIREEDVAGKPTFDRVWKKINGALKEQVVIAHNAAFDISVLKHSLDHYELPYPQISYFCTMKSAKRTWPDLPTYKLNHLCDRLGICFEHHQPGEDAEACARIALACCEEKKADGLKQLAELSGIEFGFLGHDEEEDLISAELPAPVPPAGSPSAEQYSAIKKEANLLLKEAAFREEADPDKAVDLYHEAIRLFYSAGQMAEQGKIRPISFPLNRLTLTLEKHGELKRCLFQIDLYEPCLMEDDRNTVYIRKRKERVKKKLGQNIQAAP